MSQVFAAFYRGQFPGGNIVRAWTRSPDGHCSVLVVDDMGVGTVYEAVWGGVSSRRENHYEATATVLPCPWADAEAVRAWAESKIGCRYDWRAVLMSGIALRWGGGDHLLDTRQGMYDCSRFVCQPLGLIDYADPCPPTPGMAHDKVTARLAAYMAEAH